MSITERVEKFNFSAVRFKSPTKEKKLESGFILKVRLKELPTNEERRTIIKTRYFSVAAVKFHFPCDEEKLSRLEKKDDIRIYADENGDVYVLEISATFDSPYLKEPRFTCVDLLLNVYDATKKYAYAYYDGIKLGWIYDDEEINYDYIFGDLFGDKVKDVIIDDDVEVSVSTELSKIKKTCEEVTSEKDFNFYSPKAYNAWAGDVVNFYHDKTYHLLFLYDRHHHCSRWGGGAHTMYHFITDDFKSWKECPPLVSLDEQWKSLGTGTMFFSEGKYYFTHGWHTSRMIPEDKTGSRLMLERSIDGKKLTPLSYDELKKNGLYPSGANYVGSDDGINFVSGKSMFHVSENPSVYRDDGGLFMYGGYGSSGIWRANSIDGEWVLDEKTKVPSSKLYPSDECPSMFEYNGYKYLLLGGTGYWKTDKNGTEYTDRAIDGFDVYDGLSYPMVTVTDDGRMIMAGWIRGLGWGSVVIHRELIQGEDGRLYMKWLKELSPDTDKLKLVSKNDNDVRIDEKRSYYIEFDVESCADTRTVVRFSGEKQAVLVIDSKQKTVRINDGEDEVLPLYRIVNEGKDRDAIGNLHFQGVNFAIGQVDNIQKPYKVRIQLHYEKKSDNAFIDCEIGEKRTIVSDRVNQRFSKVSFEAFGGKIKDVAIFEL